jgi:hypothetical protein
MSGRLNDDVSPVSGMTLRPCPTRSVSDAGRDGRWRWTSAAVRSAMVWIARCSDHENACVALSK